MSSEALPLPAPGDRPAPRPSPLRQPRALVVRPYDHPLRFLVESSSEGKEAPHLVCLASYNRNGRCTCKHFTCRLEPELRQGRRPSNATRCKHILHARHYFTNQQIARLSAP